MACADIARRSGRDRRVPPGTTASAVTSAAAAALALLALAAGPASGVTYKWVDEKGRVQYTDHLPPEAVNRATTQLSKQGIVKGGTEAPLTDAEIDAILAAQEREKAAEREALRKRQVENALLSSYTTENDIEVAKRRNLALVGSAILSAEARIRAQQRRYAALEKEKQFYEKKPLPEKLRREMASIEADIPKQQALIMLKNEEALGIIRRYDDQKAKYIALKRQIAEEQASAPPPRRVLPADLVQGKKK